MTDSQTDGLTHTFLIASPRSHFMQQECICKYGAVSVLCNGTIDDFKWPLTIIPTILICRMMPQHSWNSPI